MCTQKSLSTSWVGEKKMGRTLRVGLKAGVALSVLALSTAALADAPVTSAPTTAPAGAPAAPGANAPTAAPTTASTGAPTGGPAAPVGSTTGAPPAPAASTTYPMGMGPSPGGMGGPGFVQPGAPAFGGPVQVPGGQWGGLTPGEAEQQFRRKKATILAGSIIFGLTYYTTIAFSSAAISRGGINSREFIGGLIPLVGPFVTAGQRADPNKITLSGLPAEPDYAGMGAYIVSGALQLLGAGLFVAGLRMQTGKSPDPCQEKRMGMNPRCREIKIAVLPTVTPTSTGAALAGSF